MAVLETKMLPLDEMGISAVHFHTSLVQLLKQKKLPLNEKQLSI